MQNFIKELGPVSQSALIIGTVSVFCLAGAGIGALAYPIATHFGLTGVSQGAFALAGAIGMLPCSTLIRNPINVPFTDQLLITILHGTVAGVVLGLSLPQVGLMSLSFMLASLAVAIILRPVEFIIDGLGNCIKYGKPLGEGPYFLPSK